MCHCPPSRSAAWPVLLVLCCCCCGSLARGQSAQEQVAPVPAPHRQWPSLDPTFDATLPPAAALPPQGPDPEWLNTLPDQSWAAPEPMLTEVPPHRWWRFGRPQPLQGTSWLNRPYYAGAFGGTWLGESLVGGEVDQGSGFFGGYWLGTELNHTWGSELRASLFYVNTSFPQLDQAGVESRNFVVDANLLYHPWGDSRWRPYGSIGLGIAGFHFAGQDNAALNHTGLSLPIGLGVKYLCRNWLAVRLDIKDNIVFGGNGVDTTGSWSFVGGVEVHWGSKTSKRYAPW